MIVLESCDWRAEIAPDVGGSILSLSLGGRPILRPTPAGAAAPLLAACFPLIPYANRIAGGRFAFAGQAFDVGATPGFEPHALHGVGWRAPWTVRARDGASAVLALRHVADAAWPWAFEAEQRFVLSETGLTVELSMTNTDARPAPAGLGLHPYLHRPADARLKLDAARVWLADEILIPSATAPTEALFDWSGAPRLSDAPFVDNAYDGWTGEARLESAEGVVVLSASGVSRVHVYAPPDADFVCVEPVTHRPDALNAPVGEDSGLTVLGPGVALSVTLRIGA